MEIRLNGELFEPHDGNMAVYNYAGELAIYDHIFLEQSRSVELNQAYGGFVWKDEPGYYKLYEFILENCYPMHVNLWEIKDSDVNAWHEKHAHDLDETDGIPEEWTHGAA